MADPKRSRGFVNRNPGNIDYNPANKWQGQVGKEVNGRFAVFSEHKWGIRALAVLLINYQDKHNLRSVHQVIGRWAPSVENNTDAYRVAVAQRIGVGLDDRLNLHTWAHLRPLVEAIIIHECGGNPYSAAQIDEGVRLAGVVPEGGAAVAAAVRDPANMATAAGGLTVGGVIAAAAPVAQAVNGLDWRVVAVLATAALVAGGAWLLLRGRAA